MSEEQKTDGGRCQWSARLGAFHDGELSAHESTLVRAHLEGCAECAAEVTELRRIGEALASAYSPPLAASAARAMAVRAFASDALLVRTARILTACAALMLVVFSVFALSAPSQGPPVRDLEVETAAVSLDEPGELAVEPDYEFASWILADLSGEK